MAIFITSDTHFGHRAIIKYSNRPFVEYKAMDKALLDNINRLVQPNDTLYHLGDWSLGYNHSPEDYRRQINCRNITLILGNHDKKILRARDRYLRSFYEITPLKEIKAGDQSITLCHFAMRVWDKSHHGAWHLYGHSHGSLPDDPNSLSCDVGVDCWDYCPISLDQVAAVMATKKFVPIDHHGDREHEK